MSKEFLYKSLRIVVKRGDITEEDVEAIVNPANSLMIMGGGVAGAIRSKGGAEIEDEARRHAPVPVGKAVITGAGRLKAKYIVHAPTMERPAMRTDINKVRAAMRAVISEVMKNDIESLAIPALGAGVGGVKVFDSVKIIVEELKRAIDAGLSLKEVRLVAWKEEDFKEFLRAVEETLS